jgi:ABC-2 type transport system ATP-binding protein
MSGILEFDNVTRSYIAGRPVLRGVTFSVSEGEVVGLLGRNGAGKTTLIRIALGILHPHGGGVRAFGLSPTEAPVAVKKRIGYVSEDQALPPGSSIEELISFHRYLFPQWDSQLERQILERFHLSRQSRIMRLSKGESRAVALLCAVCHRPELLIMDEPAGGLDPVARREFLEVSIQLLNREGTTILFSSHYMNDVERIGGRVVVLDEGKVYLDSSMDQLREDYCLAMIPIRSTPDVNQLTGIPGCLRARPVSDDWHAIFRGETASVEQRLSEYLGVQQIRCVPVTLEELFIELMGHTAGAVIA